MTPSFDPQLRALAAARLNDRASADTELVLSDLVIECVELLLAHRRELTRLSDERVERIEIHYREDGTCDGAEADRKRRIEHERFMHERDLLRTDAARIALEVEREGEHPLRPASELASIITDLLARAPNVHRTAIESVRKLFWDLHYYAGQGTDSLYARLPADLDAIQRARSGFAQKFSSIDHDVIDAMRRELQQVVDASVPSWMELHDRRVSSYVGGRTSYVPYLRERFPDLGEDLLVVLEDRARVVGDESFSDMARLMIDELDARQTMQHPLTLSHKGYIGTIDANKEFSPRWLGRIVNTIRRIEYSGETLTELEQAMRGEIDEYLEMCAQHGLEPDPPGKPPLTGPKPLWDEHGNWIE